MKLTYANIMSTVAVVLALGTGTASAVNFAAANSVNSRAVVNGQINLIDLAPSVRARLRPETPTTPSQPISGDVIETGDKTFSLDCSEAGCQNNVITFTVPKDRAGYSAIRYTGEVTVETPDLMVEPEFTFAQGRLGTNLVDGDPEWGQIGPECKTSAVTNGKAIIGCQFSINELKAGTYHVTLIPNRKSWGNERYFQATGTVNLTVR